MRQATCALLAQSGVNPGSSVPRLPAPPWFESVLFESPWTIAVALVVVGGVLFWWFNRVQQGRRGLFALAGGVGLAAALIVTAQTVTTLRERLKARTVELVDAVARADQVAMEAMLAPDVRVSVFGRDRGFTAESIVRWVDTMMRPGTGTYAVREHSESELGASIDGSNTARTQVRVRVTPESSPLPVGSWWRVHWRRDGTGADAPWRVTQIEVLQIDAVAAGRDVEVVPR